MKKQHIGLLLGTSPRDNWPLIPNLNPPRTMTETNLSSHLEIEMGEEKRQVLSQKNHQPFRAVVYLARFGERPAAIKDYNGLSPIVRLLIAWRLVRREARAYRRLKGVEGIPEFLGQKDRYSLALEHIPGRLLSQFRPGQVPVGFFDRLAQQVKEMHRRGVVHSDIRRNNILVTNPWRPIIIDFNCSLTKSSRYRLFKNWFYGFFGKLDHRGVLKLKEAFSPESLTPEERESLDIEMPLYRCGKFLRRKVYRRIKRRFRNCR